LVFGNFVITLIRYIDKSHVIFTVTKLMSKLQRPNPCLSSSQETLALVTVTKPMS